MLRQTAEITVIGAGPAGVCAALAAARSGRKTTLISNRPVLGGNSSSEIRVWARGATGGGSLYAEEMGIWGELKLRNLYENPDANPVFWDEILLDEILAQPNIDLYLNTDVFAVNAENGRIGSVVGAQQAAEKVIEFFADYFIDATGDGSIAAKCGVPCDVGEDGKTLGTSILYYTRREDHPVRFIAPSYAYGMEKIREMIGNGGRVINEKMSGSDCWWFEYGGTEDTIASAQDIGIELKRLVMGVWNYVKNSGEFDAEYYTLDWVGNVAGKRESRRFETEYQLKISDIEEERRFEDGAFYGGWFVDSHPPEGIRAADEENCTQKPVGLYQIPLRCLFNRMTQNLLLAGRIIGTERDAFLSSRIMNTCALSGQAAAQLAAECLRLGKPPVELDRGEISGVVAALRRDDVFVPGNELPDAGDLAQSASVCGTSEYEGGNEMTENRLPLSRPAFVVLPGAAGTVEIAVDSAGECELRCRVCASPLPSRLKPGKETGLWSWKVRCGVQYLPFRIPKECEGMFVTLLFEAADAAVVISQRALPGFVCGYTDDSHYRSPCVRIPKGTGLYEARNIQNGCMRPWKRPNAWLPSPEDAAPALTLRWEAEIEISEIRLYLDPDLLMELTSSHPAAWNRSHIFTAREGMPRQLVRDLEIQYRNREGGCEQLAVVLNNRKRLVVIPAAGAISTKELKIKIRNTWGGGLPVIYGVKVF